MFPRIPELEMIDQVRSEVLRAVGHTILDIVDCEKQVFEPDPGDPDTGTVRELRAQLRELAFQLYDGRIPEVK